MRKKGFTLVELLVVIAIIALLMGILMPALARVRMIAYRMVCGTNLSGVGKAILLYAGDAREDYPLPGITKQATWSKTGAISDWADNLKKGPPEVYKGGGVCTGGGGATIGSLFYLLVKYEDVSVKQYNCKGDVGVKLFKLTDYSSPVPVDDFSKAWDFGKQPAAYCSYSYHMPFANPVGCAAGYPIGPNSDPACPLAADRAPTLDTNVKYLVSQSQQGGVATEPGRQTPKQRWDGGANQYTDPDLIYNSFAHQREGQNVLYNDGHVRFEKQANVGLDNDNIWQYWPSGPVPKPGKYDREVAGYFPVLPTSLGAAWEGTCPMPLSTDDALLINEPQSSGSPATSDGRLKDNVQPLENALDKIGMICGVTFDWNAIGKSVVNNAATGKREIGVIAQDVEAVFPELVVTGSDGYKRVDYAKMTAVLIEAVKELKAQNEALKARIDALEAAGK